MAGADEDERPPESDEGEEELDETVCPLEILM
jgi:hypothetical protein